MMREGGEIVGSGGVNEATGWEEVEALASQAPDEGQERENGNSDNLSEVENENSERLHRLNEAVFDKVDITAVLERTMKFAEKIDVDKLSELRYELRENPEMGMLYTESYFTEILDLSLEPYVRTDPDLGRRTFGACRNGGKCRDMI